MLIVLSETRVSVLVDAPNETFALLVVIDPAKLTALGAVATTPPVNAKVPALVPKVTVPVLLKVTALVIVPVLALRATL